MAQDVRQMIDSLRHAGGDTTDIEVKSAAGGLPASLTSTLSSLANQPGGGVIILGLDEQHDFEPIHLADPQKLRQGLADKARTLAPPVRLTIENAAVDGKAIILALVHECDPSMKPCRVSERGAAYIRAYDGDYILSQLEEQAFLAARQEPRFDRAPVEGATIDDLDTELVDDYLAEVRHGDPRGLGRFDDDAELLRRAGVTVDGGQPTVAGLLALGVHPQQWYPRYVIRAAADPLPTDPPGTRARNQATMSGAIPRMLDSAMEWAGRTFDTITLNEPDGSVRDRTVYPLLAFRELVANALVHRDLDHWSAGFAAEVRLRKDRLIVSNPRGLYGITVDRLGRDSVTSARNARLVDICQYVRTPRTGTRVIEALATGIPTIAGALAAQGLPPAHYIDNGIRFTAVLHQNPPKPDLTAIEERVLTAIGSGIDKASDLAAELDVTGQYVRKILRTLRERGLVTQVGGRGRRATSYHRT